MRENFVYAWQQMRKWVYRCDLLGRRMSRIRTIDHILLYTFFRRLTNRRICVSRRQLLTN